MEKIKHSVQSFSKKPVMDRNMFSRMESVRRWAGGIAFVMTIFLSSIAGFIVIGPLASVGFLLRLPVAQWIFDTVVGTWFAFIVGLFEIVYGVKIVVQGDVTKLNKNNTALLVMNHRTRLDWLFYMAIQARYGSLRRFKISLKNEIRHVPGAGWAMQAIRFLFLNRKWISDKERIRSGLKQFGEAGYHPQLLLFPEGTDFQVLSRQRSREYAEKNALDDYEYVLHPRTLGFTAVVGYMRKFNELDQIVDVTVSYPENILQRETDLMSGNIPRVIVFTIKSFEITEIPCDNDALLARWIEKRWEDKEKFLRVFYQYRDYSFNNGYSRAKNQEIERDYKLHLYGALVFWFGFLYLCVYGFYVSSLFTSYFCWAFLVCVIVSSTVGIDTVYNAMTVRPSAVEL